MLLISVLVYAHR